MSSACRWRSSAGVSSLACRPRASRRRGRRTPASPQPWRPRTGDSRPGRAARPVPSVFTPITLARARLGEPDQEKSGKNRLRAGRIPWSGQALSLVRATCAGLHWSRPVTTREQLVSVRVLVVDDTEHVRSMLVDMLGLDGFDVVGQAGDGATAVTAADDTDPDVIVMDLRMPGVDGLEATRRIRARRPSQAIVLYTAYLDDKIIARRTARAPDCASARSKDCSSWSASCPGSAWRWPTSRATATTDVGRGNDYSPERRGRRAA